MFLTWLTGMKNAKKKNRFLHTENRGNPCSTLGIQPKPGLSTVVERKFEPFEAYLFLHCLLFTTVYPGHGSRNETKMVALVLFFFPFSFFVPTFIFFFSRWFAWTRPTTIRAAWIMLSFWDPPQVSRRFNALGKLFHYERLIKFPAFFHPFSDEFNTRTDIERFRLARTSSLSNVVKIGARNWMI